MSGGRCPGGGQFQKLTVMLQQPSIDCYDATNNANQFKIVYTSPILCVFNFTLVYGWKCIGEIKVKPCVGISLKG